ncbi:MAG: hypothetical protein P8Z36_03965 [Gemmatimonadota bacterium]|jgi:hypothetical protein
MIRRIVKLMFYIKAPFKAFVVFHPVKAAKFWFAYVLGSVLFGTRKRAEAGEGPVASGWGQPKEVAGPTSAEAGAEGAAPTQADRGDSPATPDEAEPGAVPAGASAPEGHQPT